MAGAVPCHHKGWGHTSLEKAQWEAEVWGQGLPLLLPGEAE